jgi:hypothetical protein
LTAHDHELGRGGVAQQDTLSSWSWEESTVHTAIGKERGYWMHVAELQHLARLRAKLP